MPSMLATRSTSRHTRGLVALKVFGLGRNDSGVAPVRSAGLLGA